MTYRIISRGGPIFGIVGPYSETLRDVCRKIPGMQFSKLHNAWIGYADAVDVARQLAEEAGLAMSARPASPTIGDGIAPSYEKLRDYQRAGVDFLVEHAREGALLADDLGLGKTIQSIRAARAFKARTVVVCRANLKLHWQAELKKWWPKARVKILEGVKPIVVAAKTTESFGDVTPTDVVIVNFDILYAWLPTLLAWQPKTMIIDEAHFLCGANSRRTQAASSLAQVCPQRIFLTGTPMPNRVRDLWAMLNVLAPGRFGRDWGFYHRYCDARQEGIEIMDEGVKTTRLVWNLNGASHTDELKKRLSYFMLRRTKSDVKLQLPKVTRTIIELEVKRQVISQAAALQNDGMLRKALDAAADSKLPQVVEHVAEDAREAKVVVFTFRKAIAKGIAEGLKARLKGKRIVVVTGETDVKKRKAIVDSQPDVLVVTMDSMGVGISLAYASRAYFAELHYVPSTIIQAEGRLPRPDSLHLGVDIVYFIARGTADGIIKRIVIDKLSKQEETLGKSDDKLLADLDIAAKTSATEKLRKLWERLSKEDGA